MNKLKIIQTYLAYGARVRNFFFGCVEKISIVKAGRILTTIVCLNCFSIVIFFSGRVGVIFADGGLQRYIAQLSTGVPDSGAERPPGTRLLYGL